VSAGEIMVWATVGGCLLACLGVVALGFAWIHLGRRWIKIDADWDRVMNKPAKKRLINGEMVLGGLLAIGGLGLFGFLLALIVCADA